VAQTTTGGTGPCSIAVDPARHLVYVTSAVFTPTTVAGRVLVLDGRTGKIVGRLTTGPGPKAVAVNPRNGRVYVTEETGIGGGSAVAVFDGHSRQRLATIPIGPYETFLENPLGLAVNPQANTVYATNPLDGNVYTIDGRNNAVARSVAIGGSPTAITVGPSGAVFVAGAQDVVTIHPSGAVTRVAIGSRTRGVAVDATGHRAYATTDRGTVIAIAGGKATTIASGGKPWGIGLDPATGTLVVADASEGAVRTFDRGPAPTSA
jgi:YVTN family beta-propeller protein